MFPNCRINTITIYIYIYIYSTSTYSPKQLPDNPGNMILLGRTTTRIEYNDTSSQWILTDAQHGVTGGIYIYIYIEITSLQIKSCFYCLYKPVSCGV